MNLFISVQADHGVQSEGHFYRIPDSIKKKLFTYGGLPKSYKNLSETLNELCVMIRKPAIEVISNLKQSNFEGPATKYLLC